MKKILTGLLMLVFLGMTACGSSDSPSAVIQKFYMHMSAGEVNDASKLISTEGKKMAEMFGGAAGVLVSKSETMGKNGGIKNIDMLSEEITGDIAKVAFEITYGNGEKVKQDETLIKEDGAWRVGGGRK